MGGLSSGSCFTGWQHTIHKKVHCSFPFPGADGPGPDPPWSQSQSQTSSPSISAFYGLMSKSHSNHTSQCTAKPSQRTGCPYRTVVDQEVTEIRSLRQWGWGCRRTLYFSRAVKEVQKPWAEEVKNEPNETRQCILGSLVYSWERSLLLYRVNAPGCSAPIFMIFRGLDPSGSQYVGGEPAIGVISPAHRSNPNLNSTILH